MARTSAGTAAAEFGIGKALIWALFIGFIISALFSGHKMNQSAETLATSAGSIVTQTNNLEMVGERLDMVTTGKAATFSEAAKLQGERIKAAAAQRVETQKAEAVKKVEAAPKVDVPATPATDTKAWWKFW